MVVGAPIPIAVVGRTIGELSNEIVFTRGDGNLAFADGVAGEFTRELVAVGISEAGILVLADAFHHPASVDSAVMVSGNTLTIGALQLSGHAKALEFAARDRRLADLDEMHPAVLNEYAALLSEIRNRVQPGA